MHRREQRASLFWLWGLAPLLLATALVAPGLDSIAFHGDEVTSMIDGAGTLPSGPQSLAEIPNHLAPEQALGWPVLLFLWAHVAGFSEFAVRALPLFAGLLTLALVYRTGKDLFSARVGLHAALLLSAAVFLHTYMQTARTFTLVTLFATLCLWGYWHIALRPGPPRRGAQAVLLLGAAGLLYTHYFAALLLPVLGLFHLLFVPRTICCPPVKDGRAPVANGKTRRWWRPVLLLWLAALLTLPQFPALLQGLERTVANEKLRNVALTAAEMLAVFLRYLLNDLLAPSPFVGGVVALLLPLILVAATLWQLRARRPASAGWLLFFLTAALLSLFTAINEVLRVTVESRIRYLIALWPLIALLAGAGLAWLAGRQRGVAAAILALWLITGSWLSLGTRFRYELANFRQYEFHHTYKLLRGRIPTTDLLVLDFPVARLDLYKFYTNRLGAPWEILYRYHEDPLDSVREMHTAYPYLSLLYLSEHRRGFAGLPEQLGRVLCERVLDEQGFTLERYALHSVENCPEVPVRLEFEAGIRMITPELQVADGTLRLDAHFHSIDEALLARYSLAMHVIDPRNGERVAQGDTGVGPGNIVPLRSEIDIRALPPGDYDIHLALYDWQTGARLSALDLETGANGTMHRLQGFRVG